MLRFLLTIILLLGVLNARLVAAESDILLDELNNSNKANIKLLLTHNNFNVDYAQNLTNESLFFIKNDNFYEKNEEIYEFIGMFISKYKSERNIRLKLQMTKDISFNKASLNWKTSF